VKSQKSPLKSVRNTDKDQKIIKCQEVDMPVVLIAEDDVDIRNLIAMALKLQKLEVIEAFDGRDALEKTILHHPDILLLDINMPHLSGFEVCEKVHAQDELSHIPVLFVSAKVEQDEILKSRLLGVDTVIEKPFDFVHLVSKIYLLINESGTGR
jgi:DNA-binding response OmpR family regulator